MKPTTQLGATILGVLTAICAVLAAFELVSAAEAGIIEAWAGTTLVGGLILWAHFDKTLPKEPVGLAVWVLAETTVTIVSLRGLEVWVISAAQQAVLLGLVTALVALVAGFKGRQVATPVPKNYPVGVQEGAFNPPPDTKPAV